MSASSFTLLVSIVMLVWSAGLYIAAVRRERRIDSKLRRRDRPLDAAGVDEATRRLRR